MDENDEKDVCDVRIEFNERASRLLHDACAQYAAASSTKQKREVLAGILGLLADPLMAEQEKAQRAVSVANALKIEAQNRAKKAEETDPHSVETGRLEEAARRMAQADVDAKENAKIALDAVLPFNDLARALLNANKGVTVELFMPTRDRQAASRPPDGDARRRMRAHSVAAVIWLIDSGDEPQQARHMVSDWLEKEHVKRSSGGGSDRSNKISPKTLEAWEREFRKNGKYAAADLLSGAQRTLASCKGKADLKAALQAAVRQVDP
jgi:hypothetical protein